MTDQAESGGGPLGSPESEANRPHTEGGPFRKAKATDKRLKIFLWGDSGVGKTTQALHFPNPGVIDMEGGTELYGDSFDFHVLPATTFDEVMVAVDWLLTHSHAYRTLVIDPISVLWEALQKKWSDIFLIRNKRSKGFKYEFYDMQPRDWQTIKAEFKSFVRKLIALDMNVVVTARQKAQYADGQFMRVIGETFDGEKSLPYLFDVVVQMYRDEKGRFMGRCLKDRSNKLPQGEFEVSYEVFERSLGKESLDRKATARRLATEVQKRRIREAAAQYGMSAEQMDRRLEAYGARNLDELTEENAQLILQKLELAVASKNTRPNQKQEV